ncbi:hypothetical protein FB45DRAFT_982213 [Roridomyces roridus]|uniref:Tc1-like transposase DDE domain-containing protein n=1 Tax=Roridomyces roridus TaxID=1738132 RepID=A0AAD7B4D8_9AGAR|nr:hypothetical protein FB45DRAFT_982213 [Roridomyces roridus]
MGNRRISRDVKIAAVILACVGFSRSTFFRVLKLWKETGDVVRASNRPGRPRALHRTDIDFILELIRFRPDHFLDEFQSLLRKNSSRNDFVREVSEYPADYLGFIDETSKNDKTPRRRLGRALKGKRATKRRKAVRGRRLTAMGLLTTRGMEVCTVVEGSMHRDQFLGFLEHDVLPLCHLALFTVSWPTQRSCHGQCQDSSR